MKVFITAILIASACAAGAATAADDPASHQAHGRQKQLTVSASPVARLPSMQDAKNILNTTSRHREWVRVAVGSATVFAFVVYPDRSNLAPVVLVTGQGQGASNWLRAVADQVASAGFIAVVPDVLSGLGPRGGATESFDSPQAVELGLKRMSAYEIARRVEATRTFAASLPAANGKSARLSLDVNAASVVATIDPATGQDAAAATLALTPGAWPDALSFLASNLHDSPVFAASANEHAEHYAMLAQAQAQGGQGFLGANASYAQKRADLPAGFYTADATLASSKRRKEWVNIPVGGVNVRTWVVYPEGEGKAGTVVVMQHGTGMDSWVRAIADQLAQSGFIAIAPDIWSGTAADGGGIDSFRFLDDAMMAGRQVTPDEAIRRYKAARDYALALPRANGKSGSLGFCAGGGFSFQFAGEVPELNAAVVFYGVPPTEAVMAKINAPVLAFYGENDARVVATVEPAAAAMKRLGKSYEPLIYPKATHSYVLFQEVAGNPAALEDSWPRAIALLRRQLQ